MKYFITIASILLALHPIQGKNYHYEKKCYGQHVIHIVTLPSQAYTAKLLKAHKTKTSGRETVRTIAKRHNATIAINGGFFEIGEKIDGKPSFSLVVNGKAHALTNMPQPLVAIRSGKVSIIRNNPTTMKTNPNLSLLTGLPMLVENGKVPAILSTKTSDFYTQAHARTAMGKDKHNNIIIVVVEHYCAKDVNNLTMGEVRSLIKEKGPQFAKQYNKQTPADLTLKDLSTILKQEFSNNKSKTQGLAIVELAKLMYNLGCTQAINLSGGGSSTLYINGEVVNRTIVDLDAADGKNIERPVSDAIVFTN